MRLSRKARREHELQTVEKELQKAARRKPTSEHRQRKRRKAAKRAFKHLADTLTNTDFSGAISRAANALTDAVASIMRAMGSACDGAGTVFRNAADNMQPLEVRGTALSWEVKGVVCDYGVYENNALDGSSELKLITNSRRAAEKIVEIMQQDQLEHFRLNYPERIQKRRGVADGLAAAAVFCDEGVFNNA